MIIFSIVFANLAMAVDDTDITTAATTIRIVTVSTTLAVTITNTTKTSTGTTIIWGGGSTTFALARFYFNQLCAGRVSFVRSIRIGANYGDGDAIFRRCRRQT